MSAASAITPAALDTVIALLAPFFLIGSVGDMATARHTAARTLADYGAETQEELRLATEVVSFGFQALQALAEAADPTLPVTRVLRLRGSAVSLNRSAQQNQRKLDLLQRQRRVARAALATPDAREPAPASSNAPTAPDLDLVIGFIQSATDKLMASMGEAEQATATEPATGPATLVQPLLQKKPRVWSRAAQQQRVAERLDENQRRKQAEAASRDAAPNDAAGVRNDTTGVLATDTASAAMSADDPTPSTALAAWMGNEAAQAAA